MEFDVSMPVMLLLVTIIAMLLSKKAEGKLKDVFEDKKLRWREIVVLIVTMSIMIYVIVMIPQMAIMALFLFAYSMLFFMFTYLFSDMTKAKTTKIYTAFILLTFAGGTISLFSSTTAVAYGGLALYCIAAFALISLLYDQNRTSTKERWYLAALPPALFICLYLFYSRTPIWAPYLIDVYGAIFAILVILYLGSLFTWKTTLFFAGALTFMDIVLVLFTGAMISAAKQTSGLGLPVLISLPVVPLINTPKGLQFMSLGLGDFFFSGLLAIQTWKRFGRKTATLSAITMCTSFFVFEAALLSYGPTAFPGTLMIICGWLPVVLPKLLKEKRLG